MRHQVLCKQTAIIGIMAQKDKNSNEVVEHSIDFNRNCYPNYPLYDDEMDDGLALESANFRSAPMKRMMKKDAAAP